MKFICILLVLFSSTLHAQLFFSSPIDVGSTSTLQGYRPRIALNDTVPLIAWSKSLPSQGLYVSQWQYLPSYFTEPIQVFPTGSTFYSNAIDGPELICKNDTVYITVWAKTGTQNIIYLCRSFDGGMFFVDTNIVYTTIKRVEFPSISFLGDGSIGIAFLRSEADESLPEIIFTKSADKGLTWALPTVVSTINAGQPCECCPLNLSAKDSLVFVSYRNNISNIRDFYTSISKNYGASFTSGTAIDTSLFNTFTCPTSGIDCVVLGDSLFSVFTTKFGGVYQLKIAHTNVFTHENKNVFFDLNGVSQNHPCLAASGDTLILVYQQTLSAQDVFLTYKIGSGPWSAPINLTNATGNQHTPDVCIRNGLIHVVYFDQSSLNRPRYIRGSFNPFALLTNEINKGLPEQPVYPNPFHEKITIPQGKNVMVYTVHGTLLKAGTSREIELFLKTVLPGTYCLRIDGISMQKIIRY